MAGEWSRSTFTVDAVGLGHTAQNVINGFTSFLTQTGWAVASWSTNSLDRHFVRSDHGSSTVWHYTGDGAPTRRCGIRIRYVAASTRFEITCFVENSVQTALQYETPAGQTAFISWDVTAPNNFLLIGGEDGLYWETGRDGNPNNLGHGFVGTHRNIPEFYSARASADKWLSQGFIVDLIGQLKISSNRSFNNFILPEAGNRVFTTCLAPTLARGSSNSTTQTPTTNPSLYLSNRMVWFGGVRYTSTGVDIQQVLATFAVPYSPINGRYVVSPLIAVNIADNYLQVRHNGTSLSTEAPNQDFRFTDPRNIRQVKRFAAVDFTLLGFSNIQDAVSGVTYRVAKFPDGGRSTNAGVEWPTTVITTSVA
jgi:hypothetical protein